MPLIVFRSKAAGEIFMFEETARRIFEIVGKADAPRGVITAGQIPAALARLEAAVAAEKAQRRDADAPAADADDPAAAPAVTLAQRAFPLIEMLRAAQKKGADVTWGV